VLGLDVTLWVAMQLVLGQRIALCWNDFPLLRVKAALTCY
jgi:hypothetical protein